MFKKYLKYIYICIIFYFIWLAVIPLTFRFSVKPVLSVLNSATGLNVKVEKLRLRTSILPNLSLTADNINISDKNDITVFYTDSPKLNFRIFPILLGKFHINDLNAKDISLKLYVKDKLYFAHYPIVLSDEKIKFELNKLKFKHFSVQLDDNGKLYEFNGKDYFLKYKKNHIKASGNSILSNSVKSSNVDFDVDISKYRKNYQKNKFEFKANEIDLKIFSSLVPLFLPDVNGVEGILDIVISNNKSILSLSDFKVFDKKKYYSIIFPKKLNMTTDFQLKKDSLHIINSELLTDGIDVMTSGSIENIYSLKPHFNIAIDVKNANIRTAALMLPNIITEDISVPKLKEYPFYANISGKMKIKGKLPEPDIFGNLKAKNGVLINPIPNTKEGASANIDFVGDKMKLDIYVPAGFKEFVYVNGDVLLYKDRHANLKVRSSKSVSLASAEAVVNPLHEILCFLLGPVPIMDIKGIGNIDITISGTKKDPHIWGYMNIFGASARFLDVHNMVLQNAIGRLDFNNQDVYFVNKKGTLNGQDLKIEGHANLQGHLDFKAETNNQNLDDLFKIIKTSPMLVSLQSIVPDFENIAGKCDFYLNITGKLLNLEEISINENIFLKGFIKLKNNSLKYQKIPIKNISGMINFDKSDFNFDLKSIICSGSMAKIKGSLKDGICDLLINAPKVYVNDFDKSKLNWLDSLFVKLNIKYRGSISVIEPSGINANIEIIKDNKPVKNGKIISGKILLKNSNLNITNLNGFVKNKPFSLNMNIKNIGDKKLDLMKSNINGRFVCKEFDLSVLNYLKKLRILPQNIQKEVDKITIKNGKSNIDLKIKNSKPNAVIDLNLLSLEYSIEEGPKKILVNVPIKLIHGKLFLKNDVLGFDKFNCLIDNMPLLLYGNISNIYKNPKYNLHINSKLAQNVFDKYWNAQNIYPIKMYGDILLASFINGTKSNTHIKTDIRMEKNSNIYYMGATVGDNLNPVTVNFDADINKFKRIKLNKLNYNKIISSQNNKQNVIPLLEIKGDVEPRGKIFNMHNFSIKTKNSTDAKFFNIIFKKPTIKQGNFTSDIVLNGLSNNLKIVGKFRANNLEMPYLNTVIKDLSLNFRPDYINITTTGEVFSNYIMLNAKLKNNMTPPYRVSNADIYINDFDINNSVNLLKQLELKGISSAISPETNNESIDLINSLIVENFKIRAGIIRVKNIKAANLEADCALNEKMLLSVKDFKLNMANGLVKGNLSYNLLNNFMKMTLFAKDVDANALTIALFDIPNQIYGSLTGNIDISCNAYSDKTRLETLNGSGSFSVIKGRMPKLGSLEYLLKAGNLLKGGITNLSMNGIIDVITPMKTGEFSSIKGRLAIQDGIMKTVEIQTLGKDLNLYMTGKFNFHSQIADMKVFGQISRRMSTVLGAAGNISLNTLFNKIPGISLSSNSSFINDVNKIPGIELTNKISRKFIVEILGDISGENFVQSFHWLN